MLSWVGQVTLALLAVAGLGWGMFGLAQAATPLTPTEATPAASVTPAIVGELPRAWAHPTHTATITVEPTRPPNATPQPTATASPSPTAAPTGSPTPTLPPTEPPTLTPLPSLTPVHRPASGDPTRLTIPAIALDAKVVTVGIKEQYEDGVLKKVWEVADYAAGFHGGMAPPGYVGNTVIAGHNNIRGQVFKDLHNLKPGDDIYVWVEREAYRYQVSAMFRVPVKGAPTSVQQDNLRWIMPTDDQRLTLVTCWPPWSNTHRTIVVAFPVPWE